MQRRLLSLSDEIEDYLDDQYLALIGWLSLNNICFTSVDSLIINCVSGDTLWQKDVTA